MELGLGGAQVWVGIRIGKNCSCSCRQGELVFGLGLGLGGDRVGIRVGEARLRGWGK